ncbi:hypothetical protein PC120_g11850 [Phytophthora cactorum]|nr:hypothetical protein PC120_g11850 [Phytophthora cactorum]
MSEGSKERSSASFINLLRHLCSSSIVAVQDIQHQRHQIRRVPSLEVGETSCFLAASRVLCRYVFRQ